MSVTFYHDLRPPLGALVTSGGNVEFVRVRNRTALLQSGKADIKWEGNALSFTESYLSWYEHPDLEVSIYGALSKGDALRIAEGLKPYNLEEFRHTVEVRES